jgi:hypothetical protein
MTKARKETREKARYLRQRGLTVTEIAETVGASRGSVSVWVRGIILTDGQQADIRRNHYHWGAQNKGAQVNRRKFLEKRIAYQEEGRQKAREGRPLHLKGCMLYWAEGAKTKNSVYFVNSDPNMMKLFIDFLREELGARDGKMSVTIHCHQPEDVERIEQFWLTLLKLTRKNLRTTQIKQGSNSRRNVLENGVCGLRVSNTRLIQHIFGAIQEYGGFENEQWLF